MPCRSRSLQRGRAAAQRRCEGAEAKRGRAKIEIVNTRINAAIRFTTDQKQWAAADAWSVPLMAN